MQGYTPALRGDTFLLSFIPIETSAKYFFRLENCIISDYVNASSYKKKLNTIFNMYNGHVFDHHRGIITFSLVVVQNEEFIHMIGYIFK